MGLAFLKRFPLALSLLHRLDLSGDLLLRIRKDHQPTCLPHLLMKKNSKNGFSLGFLDAQRELLENPQFRNKMHIIPCS
jgi:hypothetical protein